MSGKIVIQKLPGETIAGRFEGDRLESLFVQRDDKPTLAGALFMGRIASLDKKNNTAFVDLGLGQDAFLPLSDAPRSVSQGQLLPLSVTREAVEDKGSRVTARLSKEAEARLPAKLPERVGPLFLAHTFETWFAAQPASGPAIEAFADPLAQRLEAEIENLLGAFVALPGGASLLVEPVRTLTAIDVNAGPLDPLSANRVAVPEIARQILLRNLAGRLVIDFIALGDKRRRDGLQAALKTALGNKRPCKVGELGPSGLCEITRQRVGPPLHELLCDRVGEGGCGWSPSAKTLAFRALRQALRQGAKSRLSLAAHPLILAAIKAEVAARQFVEERLGLTLNLQEESTWPPERWEII